MLNVEEGLWPGRPRVRAKSNIHAQFKLRVRPTESPDRAPTIPVPLIRAWAGISLKFRGGEGIQTPTR